MRTEPGWDDEAPAAVFAVVVRAAELAANGLADAASNVMADSASESAWLRIAAVRTLAGLLAGPDAAVRFDKLRADVHALATATGAPDEQARLSLAAIALAEAYERGAIGRCNELMSMAEFADLDIAHAAAVIAGHVVAYLAGDQSGALFAVLRRRHGLEGAP
ncbi:hypothetical protein LTT02_21875 [Mycolicibacterium smegmatis]|uniref:hypothetical protein n=1 Tax=Mycolicibacterium smegmatis TaxID=1772 RepID=UPI0005D7D2A8|nr:hypothetical protein [Mycolicibacterium smegmatis]MDF1899714.1 hypothetical protein [Mycolicibacterium smegmatis]MDF1905502.1 hypothetical protein [Mycolicibacterium smegmatis]MDF1917899.1 hypothetical protein [Mycolicibacterium smegmatis]MDF1924545.1 hypothetical protein [Mycolicibacterium smegmatis]UAK57723.1 hypothetical protein K8P01_13915 [Mycolicibacterium smegmatis]